METYNNERTVLSTVLMAYFLDIEYAQNLELQEEWFSDYFHKIVVKEMNHYKAKNGFIDEENIATVLAQKGIMDEFKFSMILAANPFATKQLFINQLNIIKKNELSGVAF